MAKKILPVFLAVILPGCAWTIRAPSAVADPVPVWITQYGKHCRVALPAGPSKFTEYGFGEWHFYALEERGIFSILRAGTGFGSGAFSRRQLTAAPDGTIGPRQTGGTRSERIEVERSQADSLRRELDARHPGEEIPRPPHWGGYRVVPEVFEFWQGRPSRLHDRLRYRQVNGCWIVERLSP